MCVLFMSIERRGPSNGSGLQMKHRISLNRSLWIGRLSTRLTSLLFSGRKQKHEKSHKKEASKAQAARCDLLDIVDACCLVLGPGGWLLLMLAIGGM